MRHAFMMRLKPGCELEYEARHDAVWPELAALLTSVGIGNYSIFRNGLDLFAYLEADDLTALDALPQQTLMTDWWAFMEPLMECNSDRSPVQRPLVEVFHQD